MAKKIIFIVGAGVFSGKEIASINLMEGLQKKGHQLFCISSSWGSKDFLNALKNLNIPYVQVRLGFISKQLTLSAMKMTLHQLIYLPYLLFKLKKIFKREQADMIVHSNFHHNILINSVIPNNTFNVFHTHDVFANTSFYKSILKHISKKMDVFVGVSNFVSNSLLPFNLRCPIQTIYNGVAIEPIIDSEQIKDECFLTIGIVGQIGEWKGHKDLIDALHLIKSKNLIKCYIFGNNQQNEYVDYLKNHIAQLDLKHQIIWAGFKKNVEEIYSKFDILIVPTRIYEALGMTAIEAGFYKKPVIATLRGGLPEIISNEYNGLLVDANNPIQLSEAIYRFIENRALIEKMGDNHFKTVNEKFRLESMVSAFEVLLDKT